VTYLQEELIDALMYCEHLKELINNGGQPVDGIAANDYQKAAMRTMSPETIQDPVLNGALGLAGESGEVADHVKKHKFQGHALDKEHVIKELGDICWYVATTAYGLGVPLSEVMERNIAKLMKRYPNGFDAERSLHREEE
jgi:NTP pyrophosphatase (non-canonical NTP hydrolase)